MELIEIKGIPLDPAERPCVPKGTRMELLTRVPYGSVVGSLSSTDAQLGGCGT